MATTYYIYEGPNGHPVGLMRIRYSGRTLVGVEELDKDAEWVNGQASYAESTGHGGYTMWAKADSRSVLAFLELYGLPVSHLRKAAKT